MSELPTLTALLKELEEMRCGIEATRSAVHTVFGVVMPGLVGVFFFIADKGPNAIFDKATLATFFLALACLGTMWTQNLWMEFLRYVSYYYLELMPRVYAASGQTGRLSFLEWGRERANRSWLPIHLFSLGALVVLLCTYVVFVRGGGVFLELMSAGFLTGATVSVGAVLLEARAVEHEVVVRDDGRKPSSAGDEGVGQRPAKANEA